MKLQVITKSSIIFAFIFGMALASGHVIWQNFISPYTVPPRRPEFSNRGDTLYKDRISLPVAKFTPPKPKRFIPNPSEVKYQGKVNVSRGLVLRSQPKQGSNRAGGVEYKANVSVLKETPDKDWVFIRVDGTKETGWVRSGNIFRN
jgi:Bacterial SH3 domain